MELAAMAERRDILCISSIDWDFIWQGTRRSCRRSPREGHRVLFLENTGVRAPRLRDLPRLRSAAPQLVEGHRRLPRGAAEPLRALADRPAAAVLADRAVDQPAAAGALDPAVDARGRLLAARRSGRSCRRRWRTGCSIISIRRSPSTTASTISRRARQKRAASRRARRRCSGAPISSSSRPRSCARGRRCTRQSVHFFPFGVRFAAFDAVRQSPRQPPDDIATLSRPLAGYVGGMHQWVDQDLIVEVARKLPHVTFAFVGPAQCDVSRLEACPNVVLLGGEAARAVAAVHPRVRRRPRAVSPQRVHDQRLSDEAERVPGDGHSGGRDRPGRDPAVQRRPRPDRVDRARRRRLCRRHHRGDRAVARPTRSRAASRSRDRTAGRRASSGWPD